MSENTHPWENDEDVVRAQMDAILKPHLILATEYETLSFDILSAIKVKADPNVAQVHATLLARVLQDLRVTAIIAPMGYTMQSWTIAASAFEAAYSMGFIGADSVRAQR